jgi:hypothetical protein
MGLKSMVNYFKTYKNELPFTYETFRKNYKTDEFMQKMIDENVIFVGGGKRKTYKILDDEKFKKAIFSLGMGGIK